MPQREMPLSSSSAMVGLKTPRRVGARCGPRGKGAGVPLAFASGHSRSSPLQALGQLLFFGPRAALPFKYPQQQNNYYRQVHLFLLLITVLIIVPKPAHQAQQLHCHLCGCLAALGVGHSACLCGVPRGFDASKQRL